MTIPSTPRKAGPYTGTGSQDTWDFDFKVFAEADILVTIANTAGVETELTLGQYSVTLNANQETSPGGTVTYLLPDDYKLSIVGALDLDQPLDLPSGGSFSPTALENNLDRMAMQMQQIKEEVDRSARLPVTADTTDIQNFTDGILRLAESADNIDTVADNISAVDTVATSIADVNAVAEVAAETAVVASNIADVTTVADDLNEPVSEINTVAANITNVNIVGGISSDVTAVAAVASDIPAVADIAADVSTVADNVADVTNFADVYYGASSSNPTLRRDGSALQIGDLYMNTSTKRMRVYDGANWVEALTNVGTITVQRFSGDDSTVAFTLSQDPGTENNTQVYFSGVYQQKDQYSVSGATLTFLTAPPTGTNNIEVVIATTMAISALDATGVTYPFGSRTVADKLEEFISASDFGVVGDGSTNDTAAITLAVAYCSTNRKRLYWPGGKTYLMSSYALSGHYYVDWTSDAANRARFLSTTAAAAAGARQFRFLGPEDVTGLTLAADIKPNQRTIQLSSVSGLAVGMVLRISGTVLWPYDARATYTKGEMHEIISIDTGTNTVMFRDSTRDSYATTEIASIAAWTPNYLSIENCIFEMPTAAVGTGGLMFSRAINARVHNCWAYGNDFYQFHNVHCVNTSYHEVETGPAYNVDAGGYGIYDLSNLSTTVDGWVSNGLRGPYDSHTTSTGQLPNRDATVQNFVIRGGGPVVYPDGASECRGIGMHGPSENVRFINGFISDVQAGIRVRGKSTYVQNVTFSGRMDTAFALSHGCGLTITDCTYDSNNFPNKISSLDNILAASRLTQFIDFGITADSANNWDFSLPVMIHDNTVLGLNDYFIKFTTSNEAYNLDVKDNYIIALPGATDTCYFFYGDGARYVYDSEVYGNKFKALNGYVELNNSQVYLGYSATAGNVDRAVKMGPNYYIVRISDDAVARVRLDLPLGVDRPNIWIAGDAGGAKMFNIIKQNATLTSWAGSTFSNLAGTATGSSLTGTTGTDGNLTVGLMNNGDLYIENRTGAARTWRISLMS